MHSFLKNKENDLSFNITELISLKSCKKERHFLLSPYSSYILTHFCLPLNVFHNGWRQNSYKNGVNNDTSYGEKLAGVGKCFMIQTGATFIKYCETVVREFSLFDFLYDTIIVRHYQK